MAPDNSMLGKQLANFRVERVIGRGGMATVYYGWDVKLERPVAIKVINARFRDDTAYAQRFVNEARAVATWFHENILQVYYADDQDGLFYFVMEYIQGSDLGQLLRKFSLENGLMPHEDVLQIGRAVGRALDYAHARGVIHRDVKPANVLISEEGRIVLSDFGLALDVAQGTIGEVFGSPHYISPEQARRSSDAVPQSDLYSLGVILYEMLTGSVPFDDPSPTTLALQHLRQPIPSPRDRNPGLNLAVEKVLSKVLRKSPAERYASGNDLMDALEKALHVPEETAPFTVGRPKAQPGQSGRFPEEQPAYGDDPTAGAQAAAVTGPDQPPPAAEGAPIPARAGIFGSFSRWWAGGCLALAIAALAGAWVLGSLFGGSLGISSGQAQGTSTEASVTRTTVLGQLLSTASPDATATLPVSSATATRAPIMTSTLPPTPVPATSTSVPPSPVPPNTDGDYFEIYYDDTGLYFKNLSGLDRSIYPIAFERIESGQFTDRFEGWRWGNIYSNFRNGFCMVIEIINTVNHLDPEECQGKHLVIRTPSSDQPYIFWTTREGSNQFRVLWDDQEITRCKIREKFCEVYLP